MGEDNLPVGLVGQAVVVEVVPARQATAPRRIGPVGPLGKVVVIDPPVTIAVSRALALAVEQGGQVVAELVKTGLLRRWATAPGTPASC